MNIFLIKLISSAKFKEKTGSTLVEAPEMDKMILIL